MDVPLVSQHFAEPSVVIALVKAKRRYDNSRVDRLRLSNRSRKRRHVTHRHFCAEASFGF
jgi:hypothetical protein